MAANGVLDKGSGDDCVAATPLTDLPAELRLLASFLDHDARPAFILERYQTAHKSNRERRIAYSNPACKFSVTCPQEFDPLLDDVIDAQLVLGNGRKEHVAVFDKRKWHVREIVDGWTVLVGVEHHHDHDHVRHLDSFETASVESAELGDTLAEHDFDNTLSNGIESGHTVYPSLDWTRHDVTGTTPWIEFLRKHDWEASPLGPMDTWTSRFRNLIFSVMANPDPRILVWGDKKAFVYNEACAPLMGRKHPSELGRAFKDRNRNREIWPDMSPLISEAYMGKAARLEDLPLSMDRHGFLEETYWDLTMLPLLGNSGRGIGVLCELKETSRLVRAERRRGHMLRLAEQAGTAESLDELWPAYLKSLEAAEEDIRFALLYTVEEETFGAAHKTSDYASDGSADVVSPNAFQTRCVMRGSIGVGNGNPCSLESFSLTSEPGPDDQLLKACLEVCKTRKHLVLRSSDGTLPICLAKSAPHRGFGDDVQIAIVQPILSVLAEHEVLGLMVVGLSPRSPFDEDHKLYVKFLVDILQKGAAFIALPQEQRRAQKIADDINDALAQQLRTTTLAAERSEAKLARMAASAPVGMYVFHGDGRPLYVNDSYLQMTGETREQFLNMWCDTDSWKQSIYPEDADKFEKAWDQMMEDKQPFTVEMRLRKPWKSVDKATGKEISGQTWVVATAFPEVDSDGKIGTIQGWLTDISHQKFSEKLLAAKLQDAIENKRQTENFIDMTSHEMRNPLSAILQSADAIVHTLNQEGLPILGEEMMLSQETAEEILDAAQTIILCAQHQKRIVDDVLTLSKLDASLLVISPDKVQPPTLVTKALKMYESEIQRAEIDAHLEIEESYSELEIDWVVLDASRLLQVVINLLTNAIKFTQYADRREIRICLGASWEKPTGKHHNISFIPHKERRASKNNLEEWHDCEDLYIQIAVIDSGRGLSDEEMKQLFQRFSQASPKTYSQYGGNGLGLFISRELCELQGGQIGVRSGDGETTFTFYVRAKKWVPKPGDDLTSPKQQHRPQAARFVSASSSPISFSRRGSTVINEQVRPGTQLSRVSSRVSRTGGDDGPPSIQEENEVPKLRPATKGRAKTTTSRPASRPASRPPSRASTWPVSNKEPLHVLVVEDNMVNQRVMSQQLRKAGCIVHVANHGIECLDFLEKTAFCAIAQAAQAAAEVAADAAANNDPIPLSVILLDLEMPTMDGLTCIRHIRERQQLGKILKHVPVIAVTANARSEQIARAIEAGMDEVVTKPIRVFELLPQMERLVDEIAERAERVEEEGMMLENGEEKGMEEKEEKG